VAMKDDRVIGLMASVDRVDRPFVRYLESIWVAPTHRRQGVFRAMLRALIHSESQMGMGVNHLLIWVPQNNDDAWSACIALGFQPTERHQFVQGSKMYEQQLILHIDGRLSDL
jgi:ribosomal protein S18 acetylase RimI-like enzyme